MYRALSFIVVWVNHFNAEKVDISEITNLTYTEVLKPYHGWTTRTVVGTVMKWTPDKKTLLERFGVSAEQCKVDMTSFCDMMIPVMKTYLDFLNGSGINFPDTV